MKEGDGQGCLGEPGTIGQFADKDIISCQEGFLHGGGWDLIGFQQEYFDGEGADQCKQYQRCPFDESLQQPWESIAPMRPVDLFWDKNIKGYENKRKQKVQAYPDD